MNTSSIRNYIALIGLLVFFVGIISMDAYYQSFGLKYYTLGMPTSHLIYQGIKAITINYLILIPYLFAAVWAAMLEWANWDGVLKFIKPTPPMLVVVIFVLTAISYPLGENAGRRAALNDIISNTSSFPVIRQIEITDKKISKTVNAKKGLRLMTVTNDHIILVTTVNEIKTPNFRPYTIFIKRDLVNAIVGY